MKRFCRAHPTHILGPNLTPQNWTAAMSRFNIGPYTNANAQGDDKYIQFALVKKPNLKTYKSKSNCRTLTQIPKQTLKCITYIYLDLPPKLPDRNLPVSQVNLRA